MKNIQSIISPNNSDEFIWWLFRGRCIIHGDTATVIHEIEPRSSGSGAMEWSNRVTLCNEAHQEIHHAGTGEAQIKALQERRIEFLEMIGREEYI